MIPTLKDTRHGKLMYYSNDDYVGKSLDLYGEYSETEWKLYEQFVREKMLIIDGGANIGAFTIPFGKAVDPEGVVYAFEPQIEIFNMLAGNIALNELSKNVKPIWGALSDKQGTIEVAILDYNQVGNFGGLSAGVDPPMLGLYNSEDIRYYSVPTYTIDSLNLPGCSLLKLDVEGMELAALIGGIQTIKAYNPLIYVENNNSKKSPELIDFLFQNEYKCWWDVSPLKNDDNYFGNKEEIFGNYANINMLCIHKTRNFVIKNGHEVNDIDDWKRRFPNRYED